MVFCFLEDDPRHDAGLLVLAERRGVVVALVVFVLPLAGWIGKDGTESISLVLSLVTETAESLPDLEIHGSTPRALLSWLQLSLFLHCDSFFAFSVASFELSCVLLPAGAKKCLTDFVVSFISAIASFPRNWSLLISGVTLCQENPSLLSRAASSS